MTTSSSFLTYIHRFAIATRKIVFQKVKDLKSDWEREGNYVDLSEEPYAILLSTPVMQRCWSSTLHERMIFVDSSSRVDATSSTLTFCLAKTVAGPIPLCYLITGSINRDSNEFHIYFAYCT